MQPSHSEHDPYNGLTRAEPTLPASDYWELNAYQRDLIDGVMRAATERTIALLKERRSALIAAAVTGQLDVGAAA